VPDASELMDLGLATKCCAVTGASRGIGRATARMLAAEGASVLLVARGADALEEAAQECAAIAAERGGRVEHLALDVTDADAGELIVSASDQRLGALDVLVNNAGGQFTAPAEEISDGGWRAVERVTVDAVWSLTRTVATRAMIPGGGGLIVFVGFSPLRGIPGFAHASAGRAAVANLASGLALEWSRYGIRSVCVAPGTIATEGLDGYDDAAVEGWARSVPLGRLGRPEEVASVIAFLASAGGAYVTGTTIAVDGGADAWGIGEPPPERVA
jgi:citronellol/citronellal dehydrogenase